MEAAVRGVRQLAHGDLTGRRQLAVNEEARERAERLEQVITELRSADTVLDWVRTEGRSGEYPIPREVLNAIKRSAR